MSDLSQMAAAVTPESTTGGHPLVSGLRQRHADLSARDGRASCACRTAREAGPPRAALESWS